MSETQFSQVLNIELNQIIKVHLSCGYCFTFEILSCNIKGFDFLQAYEHLGDGALPKFTLIISQKNHHTELFQADSPDYVPPGMF